MSELAIFRQATLHTCEVEGINLKFRLEILKVIQLEDPSVDLVGGCGVDSSGLVQ